MNFSEDITLEDYSSEINDDKVIQSDDDTQLEDSLLEGGLYPYDPTGTDIDIRQEQMSVFEILRKKEKGDLVIPNFQRNSVWKHDQKSQFIESIILNFPLPPFYFNQTPENKLIIVDGLQRTTTLYDFVNNNFALKGLKALPDLNKSYFKDLSEKQQVEIEDKALNIYRIMPSVPLNVVYDIFNRINTGGTQLNRQEIRNCIFIGQATEFLEKLANKESFINAIDGGISSTRMKDQEAILRYLAFKVFDYNKYYKGDMSDFLENAMRKLNLLPKEELEKLENDFDRVMKRTFDFFREENFRFPTKDTRGRINIAVLESVSHFFSNSTDDFLNENKQKIIKNFKELLENGEYANAVRISTGDKNRVSTRFEKANEILGKLT